MTDIVVCLSCYVYIFAILTYLTTVNQCLTMVFSIEYVSLERSPLDEAKKSIKALNKWKCQKCQRLTHFFNKQLYIHTKFLIEKWVNRHHFLIDEKNLQKFGLREGFLSV